MHYALGSHKYGIRRSVELSTNKPYKNDKRKLIPTNPEKEGFKIKCMEMNSTDMICHHGNTWHSSEPNKKSKKGRRGLSIRFIRGEAKFDPHLGQAATFMKQLKLGFNEINLLGDYEVAEVIDEGKFKYKTMHHSWSDTLSDDGKKLIYHEYTYDTDQCMDFENWVHINKKGLDRAAFKWFCMYLKAIERKDRLEKFKRLLNDVKIPFEEGDWQSIDKDCERNKLN